MSIVPDELAEEAWAKYEQSNHNYLSVIDVDNIHEYIPGAEKIAYITSNDSGWGHCTTHHVLTVNWKGNTMFMIASYDGGSCSNCDSDQSIELLLNSKEKTFDERRDIVHSDFIRKIPDYWYTNINDLLDAQDKEVYDGLLTIINDT